MNAANLPISHLARASSLNNATQTVQPSASITPVDLGPNARPGEPLQVLYITSSKDFPDEVDEMEKSFGLHQLNAGLLELGQIEGLDPDEKKSNLEAKIAQLQTGGYITDETIVIISMHGVDDPEWTNKKSSLRESQANSGSANSSSALPDQPYLLSVMGGKLRVAFTWLMSCVRNMKGDGSPYKGQIHLTACYAKRSMDLVAGDGFPYVAYGGLKTVSRWDAKTTCVTVVDLLGHCHRNRMAFPPPEKIAEHAAVISGSTVSVRTSEKSISFSALETKANFAILNDAAVEAYQTKGLRLLVEKLRHGSFASVEKAEKLIVRSMWSHVDPLVAFDAIKSKRDVLNKLIFLSQNKIPLDVRNHTGDSLLHVAIKSMDLEAINFLIAKKLDINAENNAGDLPLDYALSEGLTDIVKILISGGANPNLWVFENGKKHNFLHYAVVYADEDCVAAILESHLLEIDALAQFDTVTFSALHMAAQLNKSEVIAMLAARGANLNIKNNERQTPLQLAQEAGNVEAVRALLEAGASPSLAANDGEAIDVVDIDKT